MQTAFPCESPVGADRAGGFGGCPVRVVVDNQDRGLAGLSGSADRVCPRSPGLLVTVDVLVGVQYLGPVWRQLLDPVQPVWLGRQTRLRKLLAGPLAQEFVREEVTGVTNLLH